MRKNTFDIPQGWHWRAADILGRKLLSIGDVLKMIFPCQQFKPVGKLLQYRPGRFFYLIIFTTYCLRTESDPPSLPGPFTNCRK